eukprot:874110-Rhodomonas_salina.2
MYDGSTVVGRVCRSTRPLSLLRFRGAATLSPPPSPRSSKRSSSHRTPAVSASAAESASASSCSERSRLLSTASRSLETPHQDAIGQTPDPFCIISDLRILREKQTGFQEAVVEP